MKTCTRNLLLSKIVKRIVFAISSILLLFMVKYSITGEQFYFLNFRNEVDNLPDILTEIEITGHSTVKPYNNVTEKLKIRKDPSKLLCVNGSCKEFNFVFIVKSFIGNFGQRTAIRKTWGSVESLNVKTFFVLGYLEGMQHFVDMESEIHNDVIQFSISDTYDNLVYKTIFAIFWLVKCKINTKYVHFLDDDRMLNPFELYEFAFRYLTTTEMKMIGYKISLRGPHRSKASKYYISVDDYPFDLWPPYLIGGTILTNMQVVRKMSRAIPYTKIIKMEDTYVGIIAKILNIKLEHNDGFLPFYEPAKNLANKLSSPDYKSYQSLLTGWEQIMNCQVKIISHTNRC